MSNTQNIFEMLSDNESGDERPQKTEKRGNLLIFWLYIFK